MLLLSPLLNTSLESNVVNTVRNLVRSLDLKISTTKIKENLQQHPDYPSLLSISDALTSWKIYNVSLKVDPDKLKELPTPFIVQLREGRNAFFTVVKEFSEGELVISDISDTRWKTISFNEFKQIWTGTVTLVEPEEGSGESNYAQSRKKERLQKLVPTLTIFILLGLVFFTGITSFIHAGIVAWSAVALLCLKLFGAYVGGLLLLYDIDKSNVALQKVCNGSKNVNCGAILQSKASKVLGMFTWSEIGFIYFAGGLISLLATGLNAVMITLVVWLNVLALPYILFSLYYQWRVAKQWCVLCLTVQGVLAAEALVALSGGLYTLTPLATITFNQGLAFSLCFILPFVAWLLLKPLLIAAKAGNKNKMELVRLKNNTEIFESLLLRQKQITEQPAGLGLILGNPNAKNKIIKVCNPYCGPCAKAHPEIDRLLEHNPDLQVQIIFTASSDEKDTKAAPVRHLLAIAEKYDQPTLAKALDDWYNAPVKDYETFAAKYTMNGELQKQSHKLDAMKHWCGKTDIAFTPTFFINGYQMPEMYSIGDLKHFLT
ncbi:MAG TPA: cysteine peptidase family C39 domain-containing protein [Parasegetibacter sp.]